MQRTGSIAGKLLLLALPALLVGCRFAPIPDGSSFWPRVEIGGYEYLATTLDPVNKPYFDTLEVFWIGGFPDYTRTFVGFCAISPDPKLGGEQSVTIDPALSGSTLTVRKWNAQPLPSYVSDPLFRFPSPNAAYLFDVSNPAAPAYLGMSFF